MHELGFDFGFVELLRALNLAIGAVAADFRAGEEDLEAKDLLDLIANLDERFAEKLFDFAATQADDVGVLALHPSFVVVLIAGVVHEVEFVDQTANLEHFERSIDGDAIEFGVLEARHLVKAFGIQMLAGLIDQVQQNFALPG
jgi:hypothetical protein